MPDGAGGTEFFDTVFAKIGWQLIGGQDQLNVPVPAGVVATNCWSSADLHALMTTVRNPATNLDTEWRVHMIVVPAKLGCSRGVMYDQIGVPREGCASFSDDGYPTSDSANFGAAANKKQRDVPRAFLRSATHELTHTLNQIHQEQETARRQLDHDHDAERGGRARRPGHRRSPACSRIRSSSPTTPPSAIT